MRLKKVNKRKKIYNRVIILIIVIMVFFLITMQILSKIKNSYLNDKKKINNITTKIIEEYEDLNNFEETEGYRSKLCGLKVVTCKEEISK